MDDQVKDNSGSPGSRPAAPRRILLARMSRRQMLKASLAGMGGLMAVGGGLVRPLEALADGTPTPGGWRHLNPTASPILGEGAAMTLDARGVPVLFGGAGAETWTWTGFTWSRERPSLSPPARAGASFAYHPPTKTSVLFGGGSDRGFLADTWLWSGRTWREVRIKGPRARGSATLEFDPITRSLILYGGYGDDGVLGDTWKWDGTAWRALRPRSSPPGLIAASSAYSAILGKLILFGGTPFQMAGGGSDETWTWDGTNWSNVSLGGPPPGRVVAAMAADREGRLILLFGGKGESLLGDTWTLTSRWSVDRRSPAPPPRAGASLVYDPSSNSFLLFGGSDDRGRVLNDTWAWGPF